MKIIRDALDVVRIIAAVTLVVLAIPFAFVGFVAEYLFHRLMQRG